MKEAEHRREIENLWNEKITLYREQRDQEWEERRLQEEQADAFKEAVAAYKEQLLQEHAALLD